MKRIFIKLPGGGLLIENHNLKHNIMTLLSIENNFVVDRMNEKTYIYLIQPVMVRSVEIWAHALIASSHCSWTYGLGIELELTHDNMHLINNLARRNEQLSTTTHSTKVVTWQF